MRQLRWKRLWRRSLTCSHKRTSMVPSRSCWNGTTSALQLEEITSKGTRVSCVVLSIKAPIQKSLETYLIILVSFNRENPGQLKLWTDLWIDIYQINPYLQNCKWILMWKLLKKFFWTTCSLLLNMTDVQLWCEGKWIFYIVCLKLQYLGKYPFWIKDTLQYSVVICTKTTLFPPCWLGL